MTVNLSIPKAKLYARHSKESIISPLTSLVRWPDHSWIFQERPDPHNVLSPKGVDRAVLVTTETTDKSKYFVPGYNPWWCAQMDQASRLVESTYSNQLYLVKHWEARNHEEEHAWVLTKSWQTTYHHVTPTTIFNTIEIILQIELILDTRHLSEYFDIIDK